MRGLLGIAATSVLTVAVACSGGSSSPTAPEPSGAPSPTPPPTLEPGIILGPDIPPADQDTIRLAYSRSEDFWDGPGVTVFAYSTVQGVLNAYTEACRCPAPSYAERELTEEFTTTAPRALLVVVGSQFRSMNREILIGSALIHSMFHAIQRGHTNGQVTPVWMGEGNAEYADVHAGVRGVGFMHNYGRREAQGQSQELNEMEYWPGNSGFGAPFGRAPYNLGHFATDLLVSRTSRSAIVDYWRSFGANLRRGMSVDTSWREAFRSTFNTSVEQFYTDFEAYRARGFQ